MIIYGKNIVEWALTRHRDKLQKIYLAKEIDKKDFAKLCGYGVQITKLDSKKAQALAHGGNHQGFLAEIEDLVQSDFSALKKLNFLLILCGISDVGNIGAIARSALGLGVSAIVLCGLQNFNPQGAVRTSSGALMDLPFCVRFNALDVANELKAANFTLYGSAADLDSTADSIQKDSMKSKINPAQKGDKIALFLGSEHLGLPKKLLAKMDKCLNIALCSGLESLNVSAAAAILIDRIQNERA